jgi:hypothetical protein
VWRDSAAAYGFVPDGFEGAFAIVLFSAAGVLVWLARARRRDDVSARAWKLVGLIAAAALVTCIAPFVGGGVDAVSLHQTARQWPSTVVFPLALAGAMMWSSRRALRIAAGVAVAAGAIGAAAGSQAFLDRFGSDPFLLPAPDMTVRTLDHPTKEFTVPFGVSQLQLSPAGGSIAAISRRRDNRATIHVGRVGGALTAIDGDGALFIDEDHVFAWAVDGSRASLREVLVDAPDAPTWQLQVSGVSNPLVSLDAKSGRWRLTAAGVNEVKAREGQIGTSRIDSYRWSVPAAHGLPFLPIALSGDRALAIEPRLDLSLPATNPLGTLMFVLASASRWRSTIWALGPDKSESLGTSRFELECHRLPLADHGACQIFDASRTRFFTMDTGTRSITPVASLPGRFFVGDEPQNAWITGWYQSSPLAVRLAPADAIRVAGPHGEHAHMLAASDRAVAGIWHQMLPASGLRVDAVDQERFTALIRIYAID